MRWKRLHWHMWLWCCVLCSAVLAAATRADYQRRVNEAAQLTQSAVEKPETRTATTVAQLMKLLPAAEDVADGARLIHVNNAWLQEQFADLPQVAADEEPVEDEAEDRTVRWQALADYLKALSARVSDMSAPLPADFKLERSRLDGILARPEYQAEDRQSSNTIQRWLQDQWRRFRKWLQSFMTTSEPGMPGKNTVNVARVIIITLLAAVLALALYQGYRWWQQRQPKSKKERSREILGVEINEETTTEDLLSAARALAQQGDYRGAIRRAYIALLYELEQRGKLRLHRSKTNRDYLNALRHETGLYSPFAALTLRFEQVWYGQTQASQFDFDGFLNGYSDLVNSEK